MSIVLGALATIGGIGVVYKDYHDKEIKERKLKKDVINKWELLMESAISKTENKIEQKFEILDIFIKHYGVDCIISLPVPYIKLRELIPSIESIYQAECICELSSDKNTAYMRLHFNSLDIDFKEDMKFKWYKTFYNCRNSYGETFNISKIEEITNPNNKEIIGYKLYIKFPLGLSYIDLMKYEVQLSKIFGKCFFRWNDDSMCAECDIVITPLDNNEQFKMLKCKPWELYIAMTHYYKPLVLDYKTSPNAIIGGKNNTGKTVALIAGLINLAMQYDETEVQFYFGVVSDKQDFRVFKNIRNTMGYAGNLEESVSLFDKILAEAKRRNKLFEDCDTEDKIVLNIFDYNKLNPKNKLPFIYLNIDEITSYMPMEGESSKDKNSNMKKKCISNLWKIAREYRSCGIWLSFATQRADIKSIDPNIKGQMGNKITFYQPNSGSAMTLFSGGEEGLISKIISLAKQRECLVEYSDGIEFAKTLYLDTEMMIKLLKPYRVKKIVPIVDISKVEKPITDNEKPKEEKMSRNEKRAKEWEEKKSKFTFVKK